MEWTQFIIFFVGVFGLFIWNRKESRADIRHMDTRLDAIRELTYAVREEGRVFRMEWMEESKDFHNRLCEIEKKRK